MTTVPNTPFGPLVDGAMVEQAVIAHLQDWYEPYLRQVEKLAGEEPGKWARPRSWVNAISFDNWPEHQLPCVLVICPNLAQNPTKTGSGSYSAWWNITTAVIVSAADPARANFLSKKHAACLRWIMMQQSALSGFANSVKWVDEAYNDLGMEDARSIRSGNDLFQVEVQAVMNDQRGPVGDPPDDGTAGYDEDTTVETVNVTASPQAVEVRL